MKTVADTIDVSLSNLKEQIKGVSVIRQPHYSVEDDEWLLPMIKQLAKKKATYGLTT